MALACNKIQKYFIKKIDFDSYLQLSLIFPIILSHHHVNLEF